MDVLYQFGGGISRLLPAGQLPGAGGRARDGHAGSGSSGPHGGDGDRPRAAVHLQHADHTGDHPAVGRVRISGPYGGAFTSILFRIPGEPLDVPLLWDGYQMARGVNRPRPWGGPCSPPWSAVSSGSIVLAVLLAPQFAKLSG